MDFYVNSVKLACPCCGDVKIVKQPTNHDNVLDCFCGIIDQNGELVRSNCNYEWKETIANK